jgi:hypothetical protein
MSVDPLADRQKEAATAKAEAEAAKARAEADKAAAEARSAEATAQKSEQEVADHDAPAARTARDAESAKKAAEAEKSAADSRRAQLSALIPDLSTVKPSKLDVKGDGPPLWSTFLLGQALDAAAVDVAGRLGTIGAGDRVLVTSDPDLASADSVYWDVKAGLDQLAGAAKDLIDKTAIDTQADMVPALDAVGAIATAVPAVLSLLSAERTLTSTSLTPSDLAATSAVIGALKGAGAQGTLVHDGFRTIESGGVYADAETVSGYRQQLVGRKIELADANAQSESDLSDAQADVQRIKKLKPPPADVEQQLESAEAKVQAIQKKIAGLKLRAGLVDSLLTSIDSFQAAIRVVPEGAHRSALASAALHEQLHGVGSQFTHVLLVTTQTGSAQQVLENRPLWFNDKYTTAVEASITYMLISTGDSAVAAAGTAIRTMSLRGKIGDRPAADSISVTAGR